MIRRLFAIVAALAVAGSAQVEVKLRADQPQDQQWARLTVSLKNVGTSVVQAPRAAFDLAIPTGKIPVVESWSVGSVRISLEKRADNGAWRLWFNYDGNLAASQEWNSGNGAQVGVHLSDWSTWQPWTSPSFDGNTGVWAINQKITVWNAAGQQIWGPPPPPPVSAKGYSSVFVKINGEGSCNATGTVVLVDSDRLDLRCMRARASLPAQIWVDGNRHNGSDSATIRQDGKDHVVDVRFVPRDVLWAKVSVVGPGTSDPLGDFPVFRGDSLWISGAAQENAKLSRVQVNGNQMTVAARTLVPNLQSPLTSILEFSPVVPWTAVQVTAKREALTDSLFTQFRIQVKNVGSRSLATGWTTKLPFRVPNYLTPALSAYDVPSATASIASLGDGWWMLTITSTQALPPGGIGGDGRGWLLALRYNNQDFRWDRTGDVALSTTSTWTAAPYIRVFGNDGNPVAGKDWLMTSRRDDKPNIEVFWLDEGLTANIIRPRILIKNNGPGALSDFYYDYFFCTENGKQPVMDPYYQVAPRITLEALGGFCYKVRYDFLGVTVAPGNSIPNNTGNVVGVHYSDWLAWDRTNDWSHISNSQTLVSNPRIPVYDRWGNRLTGTAWTDPGQPGDRKGDTLKVDDDVEVVYVAPVIVVQPADARVDEDKTATFEVRATGDGQILYQWRRNGQDIPGATGSVYRIDRARAEMDGDHYQCQVKSGTGKVLTREALLTVVRKPLDLTIGIQTSNDTVRLGGQARFEVYATGNGKVTYQWYKGSRPIAGQKTSILTLPIVSPDDTLEPIWVRVTDANGQVRDSRVAFVRLALPGPAVGRMVVKGFFAKSDATVPSDTSVDLSVRLYSTAKGGTQLWTEEHWDVPVLEGGWSIELGKTKALEGLLRTVAANPTLYLEVVLEGGMPRVFTPRILLTATPYSLQAGAKIVLGIGIPPSTYGLGTLYLDQSSGKTWFRDTSGWRALDQ